ncbi:hypothetical protein KIV40_09860 [Vibrio sp. D173a]|uniref:hypothetical protein n=1 Tax=Vibrio sp. D173a TaxID=2836349 RepID=UPI002557486F|nr:hypothetical protein [Vibrio sp. D173a]MDK9755724.1 hypothetical protein [Vibrio sp. D173a]
MLDKTHAFVAIVTSLLTCGINYGTYRFTLDLHEKSLAINEHKTVVDSFKNQINISKELGENSYVKKLRKELSSHESDYRNTLILKNDLLSLKEKKTDLSKLEQTVSKRLITIFDSISQPYSSLHFTTDELASIHVLKGNLSKAKHYYSTYFKNSETYSFYEVFNALKSVQSSLEPDDSVVDSPASDDDAAIIFESAKKFEAIPEKKGIDNDQILSILAAMENLEKFKSLSN